MKKRMAILGSTGSIGTQALDVIEAQPNLFEATVLTAGNNWQLLTEQALKFHPTVVVIANESHFSKVQEALSHTSTTV